MIRHFVRYLKQRFRLVNLPVRPVVDLVDFGSRACTVLDVGASRGGFAGDVLLRAPLATVHCFEPNSAIVKELRKSAIKYGSHLGQPRCIVEASGVGENHEQGELIVTGLAEASSFLTGSQQLGQGWPQTDFTEHRRELVEIIRLDDYMDRSGISSVKLLKLDIQGLELSALKGCGQRLEDIEYIICEVQFVALYESAPLWDEIVKYLQPRNFKPLVMDGFCFGPSGQPLQADILFKRTYARLPPASGTQ